MYTKWDICCLSFHLWKLFKENKEPPVEDSEDSGGWGGAGGPISGNARITNTLSVKKKSAKSD